MKETRTERTQSPLVPATAASKGLGYLPVGSAHSRAAARALVDARQELPNNELQFVARSIVTGELLKLESMARENSSEVES